MQNKHFSLPHTYKILSLLLILVIYSSANAQVSLRDTVVNWQHHEFELNEDHSMKSWSTNSSDIMQVSYPNSKVLENELIRLVIVPEYGARVLSFVYKPTGHEYLYQSECGSAYGMGEGNFYYNWLMVWGGIFPTFPESEHGKTWLLPWDYSLLKNTPDTISIRMEYTDSKSFSNAPGRFNNGVTGITCRVDVSVYSGSSLWDFRVTLINNKNENVIYEYWTCTTLTPGSESGNTSSPLNSEMIVPIDLYSAGWSPGGWIGNYGSLYNFSTINFLSEWNDMGIAYAHNLNDDYWGVINQNNQNGIFRVADNLETFGMKFWTWGKNAINSNMFDFHNGGKDSYIELWAGVSDYFFTDAVLAPNQVKSWNESYSATVGLSAISAINRNGAVDLQWDVENQTLSYHLNVFSPFNQYDLNLSLAGNTNIPLAEESFTPDLLGNSGSYELDDPGLAVPKGLYTAIFELSSQDGPLILRATKEINAGGETSAFNPVSQPENDMRITQTVPLAVNISLLQADNYNVRVYNTIGQLVTQKGITGNTTDIQLPSSGVYIFNVSGSTEVFNRKVLVR
jgi:hypothetical protein